MSSSANFKHDETDPFPAPSTRREPVAVNSTKRCPNPMLEDSEIEIRQVFEAEDFGAALTPELRAQDERLRKQVAAKT